MTKDIYRVATSASYFNNPAVLARLLEQDLIITTNASAVLFLQTSVRDTRVMYLPYAVNLDETRVAELVNLTYVSCKPITPDSVKITSLSDLIAIEESCTVSQQHEDATKACLRQIRSAINTLENVVHTEGLRQAEAPAPRFDTVPTHHVLEWLDRARDYGMVVTRAGGCMPYQAYGTMHSRPFYFRARHGSWRLSVAEEGGDPVGTVLVYEETGNDPHNGCPPHEFVMGVLMEQGVRFDRLVTTGIVQ